MSKSSHYVPPPPPLLKHQQQQPHVLHAQPAQQVRHDSRGAGHSAASSTLLKQPPWSSSLPSSSNHSAAATSSASHSLTEKLYGAAETLRRQRDTAYSRHVTAKERWRLKQEEYKALQATTHHLQGQWQELQQQSGPAAQKHIQQLQEQIQYLNQEIEFVHAELQLKHNKAGNLKRDASVAQNKRNSILEQLQASLQRRQVRLLQLNAQELQQQLDYADACDAKSPRASALAVDGASEESPMGQSGFSCCPIKLSWSSPTSVLVLQGVLQRELQDQANSEASGGLQGLSAHDWVRIVRSKVDLLHTAERKLSETAPLLDRIRVGYERSGILVGSIASATADDDEQASSANPENQTNSNPTLPRLGLYNGPTDLDTTQDIDSNSLHRNMDTIDEPIHEGAKGVAETFNGVHITSAPHEDSVDEKCSASIDMDVSGTDENSTNAHC